VRAFYLLRYCTRRGAETGQNTRQLELGLVQNRKLQERGGCVFPPMWSGVRTDTERMEQRMAEMPLEMSSDDG